MEVINDNNCSWINDLSLRSNILTLSSNFNSEWLIIGAGYTGLSAARKLGLSFVILKVGQSKLKRLFLLQMGF